MAKRGNNALRRNSALKRAAGFSLIEVLVAMLLLAIGVLGAASMQLQALKYNQTAGARTQASFLAYSILDCMRANRVAAVGGDYNIGLEQSLGAPEGVEPLAKQDLRTWVAAVKQQLPEGEGSVAHTKTGNAEMVTIVLRWSESRVGGGSDLQAEEADRDYQTFTFVTQL